jgi:uncharacterized protein DUF3106
MKLLFGMRWMAIAITGASQCSCPAPSAQTPTNNPSVAIPTNVALKPDLLPPTPTMAKSPVDFFRELSALSPAERRAALGNRSPENRKAILAKIREYEALKPDQRNLRLKATELRYYLLPLMRMPPTNRVEQLNLIPEEDRKMVEDHLKEWDAMPPALQAELLQHQDTIRYLLEIQGVAHPSLAPTTATNLSLARRTKLEKGIQEWQSLSETERDNMMGRFKQFFDLTESEQKKTLNTLSEAERRQIEKTLKNYAGLAPGQRNECLRSFNKFASMNLIERQQFLKNAEKWKLMTPDERATWRNIVEAAPLLPPAQANTPPLPPFPKASVPRTRPLANNTN